MLKFQAFKILFVVFFPFGTMFVLVEEKVKRYLKLFTIIFNHEQERFLKFMEQ